LLSQEDLSKYEISAKVVEVITGELLGDGHIRYKSKDSSRINGRLEFTFSEKNLPYAKYLKYVSLASICTDSELIPWPNPELRNKKPTQY